MSPVLQILAYRLTRKSTVDNETFRAQTYLISISSVARYSQTDNAVYPKIRLTDMIRVLLVLYVALLTDGARIGIARQMAAR